MEGKERLQSCRASIILQKKKPFFFAKMLFNKRNKIVTVKTQNFSVNLKNKMNIEERKKFSIEIMQQLKYRHSLCEICNHISRLLADRRNDGHISTLEILYKPPSTHSFHHNQFFWYCRIIKTMHDQWSE